MGKGRKKPVITGGAHKDKYAKEAAESSSTASTGSYRGGEEGLRETLAAIHQITPDQVVLPKQGGTVGIRGSTFIPFAPQAQLEKPWWERAW